MQTLKILLIASILSIIPSQLLRIPFFLEYGAINLTDIFVVLTNLVFVFYILANKKPLKLSRFVVPVFFIFSLWVICANIFSLTLFSFKQTFTSSLFLLRLLGYFFISQVILNTIKKEEVLKWINLILSVGVVFILLGFLQLLIFPDLTPLVQFGWDPHQRRIVSTILDPNFAGFIFTALFAISSSILVFSKEIKNRKNVKNLLYLSIATLSLVAVVFTFSRSSYLALIVVISVIGLIKSPKMLFVAGAFLIIAFATIGQVRTRVIGAFTLDETSQARIISWENATTILSKEPIFGVGFNNYRFAQEKYQLFESPSQIDLHSSSGSDSSILLVAATTGVVGLILFLALILSILVALAKRATKDPIKLATFSIFLALTVHSQFVNSFFFPQIAILIWTLFGLSQVHDL